MRMPAYYVEDSRIFLDFSRYIFCCCEKTEKSN